MYDQLISISATLKALNKRFETTAEFFLPNK